MLKANARQAQSIALKPLPIKYTPKEFYIINVSDDRDNTTSIGNLRDTHDKPYSINLEGGAAAAIAQYLAHNLNQDKSQQAIALHIGELHIEQKPNGMQQQISLSFGVAFYSNDTRLIEYTGTVTAHTSGNASNYAEQMIRQALEKSIKDFDSWWKKSKANYTTGSLQITPQVIVSTATADNDIIVFSKKPLDWSNFTGKPDNASPADAATYSGFLISLSSENKGNTANVTVTITPVFYKSRSWYKPGGKNAYALAHEQLHFNISGILACELAAEIRSRTFSYKTIRNDIEALHKKYTDMQYQLQQAYDEETEHGMKYDEQEKWQKKITERLAKTACY